MWAVRNMIYTLAGNIFKDHISRNLGLIEFLQTCPKRENLDLFVQDFIYMYQHFSNLKRMFVLSNFSK
jgi:hypothetical protein